jgi:hypothetical protein
MTPDYYWLNPNWEYLAEEKCLKQSQAIENIFSGFFFLFGFG